MNAFHVVGGLLALWAVVVAFLGITREHFPGSPGAERAVATISVALVIGAIFSAIYTGATEEQEHQDEEAALVLRA